MYNKPRVHNTSNYNLGLWMLIPILFGLLIPILSKLATLDSKGKIGSVDVNRM